MEDNKVPVYRPSKKEQTMLDRVLKDWQKAQDERNRSYRCLSSAEIGERSVNQFFRDNRDYFNGFTPKDRNKKEWQSNAFRNKTRNKVIATVANFISMGLGLDFKAVNVKNRLDRNMSTVIEDCYDWSAEREEFEYTELRSLMEMTIAGTVHLQEEIVWEERKVKMIKDLDARTGKVETEEKNIIDFKGAKTCIVPNEEMYPANYFIHNIQDQPFVIRRTITSFSGARALFSRWKNWKYVMPGSTKFLGVSNNDNTEIETNTDDKVEIVYYWNKPDDSMAIIANSILLTQSDYPFPYPHKNYPLVKSIYEPFADQRFYWGNSLVNKNLPEQMLTNDLWRNFADSSKLQLRPPLFSNSGELSGTDLVVPGAYAVLNQGEQVQTIPELAQGIGSSSFSVLEMNENQMNESSIDPIASGTSPDGSPTATEVNAIIGSTQIMKGFNMHFIGHMLVEHARLRIPNILWLVTHDKDFAEITMDGVKVWDGTSGKKIIKFVNAGDVPESPEEALRMVGKESAKEMRQGKEKNDMAFVIKDNLEDYRFHVSVSPQPKPKKSSASRIERAIQKYQLYAQNPIIDQQKNTTDLVEALGDNPEEMIQKPTQSTGGDMAGAPQGMPQTVEAGGQPQTDSAQGQMANFMGL